MSNVKQQAVGSLLVEHFSGAWGTDPKSDMSATTVLRSTDIDDEGHVDLTKGAPRLLSPRELSSKRLCSRDILLEASGGGPGKPVGRPAWFSDHAQNEDFATSNFFKVLRPDVRAADPKFLLWSLLLLSKRPEIWRYQQQTTGIINLKFADYLKHKITVPSLPEQRRIAEILDAVDYQIHLVGEAEAKCRDIFAGLILELLTRGVDSAKQGTGEAILRYGTARIRLPGGWTVKPISELLLACDSPMRSGPFGSALLKHELVDAGVPLLGIDNVHTDRFVSTFVRFVTPAKSAELSRYRVRPRDVMITIMGTVGRSCLVPEDIGEALSSKHVWTMTFDESRYRPYLISLQLNHAPWARAHLRRDEQGGIMNAIRSETLKSVMLPVPPPGEQCKIEQALKAVERSKQSYSDTLSKLRSLKAGLMADLLSGRVRVPQESLS